MTAFRGSIILATGKGFSLLHSMGHCSEVNSDVLGVFDFVIEGGKGLLGHWSNYILRI